MKSSSLEANNNDTINTIKSLRKLLKPLIKEQYNKSQSYKYNPIGKERALKITTDALIYLTLSRMSKQGRIELYEIPTNPVLMAILNNKKCEQLISSLNFERITFQNVINTVGRHLGLVKRPEDDMQSIINSEDLKDKPEIKLALQMYIMRGKFNWVPNIRSEFPRFLQNDMEDSLKDSSRINCWEAVMYGMMKAGTISKEDLKVYYKMGCNDAVDKLEPLFDFKNSQKLNRKNSLQDPWPELLSKKSFFIMLGKPGSEGMDHDMISVPYSQKQLLKMLVTRDFNEKPLKPKLYSHWCEWTDGKLDSVQKEIFNDKFEGSGCNEFHVKTTENFAKRIKQRIGLDNF